jgi:hypothetical protein
LINQRRILFTPELTAPIRFRQIRLYDSGQADGLPPFVQSVLRLSCAAEWL